MSFSVFMPKSISVRPDLTKRVTVGREERDRSAGKMTRGSGPPSRSADQGVTVENSPDMDSDADPDEAVWVWVLFKEVTRSIAICNDFPDRTMRSAPMSLRAHGVPSWGGDELVACRNRTRVVVHDAQ